MGIYSAKALKRMLALLALGAGGASVEDSYNSEFSSVSIPVHTTEISLPSGVHRQPKTREGARDAIESFPPIITNPIEIVQPHDQPQAPTPIIPSNQVWVQGLSPGGKPIYTAPWSKSAQTPGSRPIYTVKKIRTRAQQISNKELVRRMRKGPSAPTPVRLTPSGLQDYLDRTPMNTVETTINLLKGIK